MQSVDLQSTEVFLKELKNIRFSFAEESNTGTENFAILLEKSKDYIKQSIQDLYDSYELFNVRKDELGGYIETYSKLYIETMLEERFSQFKKAALNVPTDSEYIYILSQIIDLDFNNKIYESDYYYDEYVIININLMNTITLLDYSKQTIEDIDKLIEKCNSI